MVLYDTTTISQSLGLPLWLLGVAIVWSLIWKGLALWKSAKRSQPIWFIVLLVVNTLGLLEILYIFLFSKINLDNKKQNQRSSKKRKTTKKAKGRKR